MVLVKSLYALPTCTRTVALVTAQAALRRAIGCPEAADAPSVHACYRFMRKRREHKGMLDSCIAAVIASLRSELLVRWFLLNLTRGPAPGRHSLSLSSR